MMKEQWGAGRQVGLHPFLEPVCAGAGPANSEKEGLPFGLAWPRTVWP